MSITTDNGSNFVLAVKKIKTHLKLPSIIQNRCAGHIIDLAVSKGLKINEIQTAIEKIRIFAVKIHRSTQLTQLLLNNCEYFQEPKIRVKLDVDTRWNSTHEMVKEILRIRQTFDYVAKSIVEKKAKDENFELIESNEWDNLELVAEFLEPFNQGFFLFIE